MGVIDSILQRPSAWTGTRVLEELPVAMYGDERRRDRSVPSWLRAVLVLLDFDVHVQMEGLLGWWENRASEDLDDVLAAFRTVGLPDQADLLVRVRAVLDPRALDVDPGPALDEVSSFADRHAEVTEEQYRAFERLEEELYLNADDGADLHAALVVHADACLPRARCAGVAPGKANGMTTPDDGRIEDDKDEAAGNTGALAAASKDGSDTDPLAPLTAVTEDDDS